MIEIEISSNTALDAFNRWLELGREPDEVLQVIGAALEKNVRMRFETKTDPNGSPWAAWSPSTVVSYPKNGNKSLLNRYGDLMGGISHQVSRNTLLIGFNQPYSLFHEFGTKKMPRRGLLLADPEAGTLAAADEAAIVEALQDALSR